MPLGPVVTLGEALASLEPVTGRLEVATELELRTLGAEYNYAIDLARLGVPVQFFGAVGADPLGRRVLRGARAEGVDVSGVTFDASRPTGLLFKDAPGMDGEREIHYLRSGSAASGFGPTEELRAAASAARGAHVTGISLCLAPPLREAALTLLAGSTAAAWKSFDLNVRLRLAPPEAWARAFDDALPHITTFFATAAELASAGLDLEEVLRRAAGAGVVTVLRFSPDKTLIVHPDGREEHVEPIYSASPVDPVGTGDAFAAAVTACRLSGLAWTEAVRGGHIAGAMVASVRGDFEGAPHDDELRAWMEGKHVNR